MVEGKDAVLQAYKEYSDRVYKEEDRVVESRICSTGEYEEMLIG